MVITRRTTVALAALLAVLAGALGARMALAQSDEDAPAQGGAAPLLERLDEIDAVLPEDLQPEDVELDEEETWGALEGDFGGAAATIGTVEDDLEDLFVDADDRDGAVPEAVAAVARGWLDLRLGYDALADAESYDLAFPLETEDDDDVATGADAARGAAERGLHQVLAGHERLLTGYVALREEGAAEDAAVQGRLDARAVAAEQFDQQLRPQIHRLLSLATTMTLHVTERFDTDAPGIEARARSYTVTCVDRDAAGDAGGPAPDEAEAADDLPPAEPRADCPDLPDGVTTETGPGGEQPADTDGDDEQDASDPAAADDADDADDDPEQDS